MWRMIIVTCAALDLFGCSVDRSGLGPYGGGRDASTDRQEVRDAATSDRQEARDASPEVLADVTGEASSDVYLETRDLGATGDGEGDVAPDSVSAESGSRDLAPEAGPEAGREAGRESGPEAASDLAPPSREAGPEVRKCSPSCYDGCNVGCGPEGRCIVCPTCSCSVESGLCHC